MAGHPHPLRSDHCQVKNTKQLKNGVCINFLFKKKGKVEQFTALATPLYVDWLPQANGPPRVLQSVHVNQSEYTQCQQGCGGRLLKPSLLPCPSFFSQKDIHYSVLNFCFLRIIS